MRRLMLVIAIALLLPGCPATASSTPLDPALAAQLLVLAIDAGLIADIRKKKNRTQEALHQAFFVWKRLIRLHAEKPTWFTLEHKDDVKNRIQNELHQVKQFLDTKLGANRKTGPLVPVRGGTGDAAPNHLDLADLARVRVTDNANDSHVKKGASDRTDLRVSQTIDIVWRATAIEPLWNPSSDSSTAALAVDDLSYVLDRRLRSIERMANNVSKVEALLGGATPDWKFAGPHGPWKDGTRVRLVEYPRVRSSFSKVIGTSNIGTEVGGPTDWVRPRGVDRLEYNRFVTHGSLTSKAEWRFPTQDEPHWDPSARDEGNYYIDLVPKSGATAASVIDSLFDYSLSSKQDYWGRAWLWCDHTLAALHVEALLFGLRRHSSSVTAGEEKFNDLVARRAPDNTPYVGLGANLGPSGPLSDGHLMKDADDNHFENTTVDVAELQTGDQLIFWNSAAYQYIAGGDWQLENAFVMMSASSVQITDKPSAGVEANDIKLQGHGTEPRTVGGYRDMIIGHVQDSLSKAQAQILAAVGSNAHVQSITVGGAKLIRWSPYEEFASPGAWWALIPWTNFGSPVGAVMAVSKAINPPEHPGTGYHAPPALGLHVLFPIYEPKFASKGKRSAWDAYLEARAARVFTPPKLVPTMVDPSMAPGLSYTGRLTKVPVLRPRAERP